MASSPNGGTTQSRSKRFCPYCGLPTIRKQVDGRLRRYCPACRLPLYENPVPAACCVVTDTDGRILLVRRNVDPKAGQWCLPGGFMELDETPQQAALRELHEETGIQGRPPLDLLGAVTNPSDLYHTVLVIGYRVTKWTGSPFAGDDASQVGWFAPADLPPVAFSSHRHFIRLARNLMDLN